MYDVIKIQGAREHNLKNVDLELPRNQFIVFTGLSGSGKSSLAFDTLYAEGQRRYVESLSSYARQFLGVMEKPDVDQIEGLSPAISIDQKSASSNPRSTVATVTEIYDYLRLAYARLGTPHCPVCGQVISRQAPSQIVDTVAELEEGERLLILAPIVQDKKGEHKHIPAELKQSGYSRVRVNGVVYDVDEFPDLDKQHQHTIEVVVDRLKPTADNRQRLAESIEGALELADGLLKVINADSEQEHIYSEKFACVDHPEAGIAEMAPRNFSFNSPHGACEYCTGLGTTMEVDPQLVVPNQALTIEEGAIHPWRNSRRNRWYQRKLAALSEEKSFPLDLPFGDLDQNIQHLILHGEPETEITVTMRKGREYDTTYEGVIPNLQRLYRETDSNYRKKQIKKYMNERPCPECGGRRLKPEVLAVTLAGKSIAEVAAMSIADSHQFFENIDLDQRQKKIGRQILKEVRQRLNFLNEVGLNYLTLDRSAGTLSGGEAQRIRLATQIGSGLMGVLYVLDEPSIGLHQRDNDRLLKTLLGLRDLGNTVLVVEHDEETIRRADTVVDIGPGAGEEGGEIVAVGNPEEIAEDSSSLTGQFLSGDKEIPTPNSRRQGHGQQLVVREAKEHNLKEIDVEIPLGTFTVISGVSGSGKSTLVNDILARRLSQKLHGGGEVPGRHRTIEGMNHLDKVVNIDQSPIGRTPRSNPATYTKVFTDIRKLFAQTPEARIRGYDKGRFSFNVRGGRCEVCGGDGSLQIEMHFLPDVYITCEECGGKRYNQETLEIHYKGKDISQVLDMTVTQAHDFFENIPKIKRKLNTLRRVGLGYIRLGQPATTLSGGEAQRVKLSSELSRRSRGQTLYILDEPTTGLHFADVKKLLQVLGALVEKGNTVVVIEHDLDVVKSADHVIDLGPEGGEAGGEVVTTGTPEEIAESDDSYTGQYLRGIL